MVEVVKRAQSFKIQRPKSISPDATAGMALDVMKTGYASKRPFRALVVLAPDERFLGIVTVADLQFCPTTAKVQDVMTPTEKLSITHNPDITLDEARRILHEHKVSNVPIVDKATGKLRYLITAGDVRKLTANPLACQDAAGRLRVGAAVGVKRDDLARARALVNAGADVLVIDIAHGHSDLCTDMIKALKADPVTSTVDIIAGNIATRAAAVDLVTAGADGLKVGVGPGSICITRTVAGSGVPQFSALLDVCSYANEVGVPCIADGGVRTSGDIAKAMAAGASTVMLGNALAGTDESPGRVLVKDGRKVKIIRGMAGYGANISKAEREQQQDEDIFLDMVPEGVEGMVAYKGPVGLIVRQLVGGVRSGISYCGATNLEQMRERARFVRMTPSGLKESGHHDISKM
jgi:IMP dehydrogenase